METVDWIIVLALNGGVMAFGLWLARGTKTSADWFLGKRTLAWWAIGLSIFATNVDNADLVSMTGKTYTEGMHYVTVHTLGALLGASFAAFWLVPAMARAGQFTNAEYLESRFGPSVRLLSALIQIQYRTSMLGLMIWSVYLLLTTFLGLSAVMAWMLIVTIVAIAGIYTSWGGLRSVVFTDALQGVIMFIGMAVIFIAVWNAAGGWSSAVETLKSQQPAAGHLAEISSFRGDDGATSPWVILIAWIVIAGGYWSVNHSQTMRLAGARSIWDMKMAALFGVVISMPIMVGCIALGVLARSIYPDIDAIEAIKKADELYPFMASQFLGVGLKGIVVAGMFAAAVSTFDSMGSALSALFTRDIYARFISKNREDSHYVLVSRLATAGVLALGFAYIPFISAKSSNPDGTMLDAFLTLIPVFVTPLFTVYIIGVFTRAPRMAGIAGILTGALYGVIALVDREVRDVTWLASWFTSKWPAYTWAMVFTALGAGVASIWFRDKPTETTEKSTWLETSSSSLEKIPEHPFSKPPPRWARPEVIAVALIAIVAVLMFAFLW
ncbi:MAG: SSS family solute:Na+ symporter [Verrucomicrobiales bacterium]|jgi:SSS family solute:Na+ symporter